MKKVVNTVKRTKLETKKKAAGARSAKSRTQAATDSGVKPGKIVMSSYPLSCNCKLCSLDFCDCSEEEQGTVASAAAPATCGE